MLRAAQMCLLIALFGCAGGEESGPPKPSKEQRIAVAQSVDEARGWGGYAIDLNRDKLMKIGKPISTTYTDAGTPLDLYQVSRAKLKVGDVEFQGISLFFDRSDRLAMARIQAPSAGAPAAVDRAACDTARVGLADTFGPGDPIATDSWRWLGHEVVVTWEYATVRGTSGCYIEWRRSHLD